MPNTNTDTTHVVIDERGKRTVRHRFPTQSKLADKLVADGLASISARGTLVLVDGVSIEQRIGGSTYEGYVAKSYAKALTRAAKADTPKRKGGRKRS